MRRSVLLAFVAVLALASAALAGTPEVQRAGQSPRDRSSGSRRFVRVIVQTTDPESIERVVRTLGGRAGRRLTSVPGVVAEVPVRGLEVLSAHPGVRAVDLDRPIRGTLERTAATIGARWVAENLGVDGTGIGVAIIDSGVTRSHDDLATRVVHFVDFVDFQGQPYDGYGHGTHVAGIIAGSGQHSDGARRGIAPGAHLVVLKTLDRRGDGYISNAIAALDYAIEQRAAYNIRVINLSVAAGVYESYKTDPLTLAAARAVDAGIVVVTAAGNLGRHSNGRTQYGGITAPGNAPWVLTVGASSHNGTIDRSDDSVAPFSSMGPSAIDLVAKPDLLAPGVGIESTADAGSTLFMSRPDARLWGTGATATEPYLSLSGTSMASPVVAATVALMVQANPTLTPAAVKAILRGSAEPHDAESTLAQGAGFLNARAAVEVARSFAETPTAAELLDDLVEVFEVEEGLWTAPCDSTDIDCRYLTAACTEQPGCFEELGSEVAAVTTSALETVLWDRRTRQPLRRRRHQSKRTRARDDGGSTRTEE
jgi:serine protease AprX